MFVPFSMFNNRLCCLEWACQTRYPAYSTLPDKKGGVRDKNGSDGMREKIIGGRGVKEDSGKEKNHKTEQRMARYGGDLAAAMEEAI